MSIADVRTKIRDRIEQLRGEMATARKKAIPAHQWQAYYCLGVRADELEQLLKGIGE